jgi:hypothetical protein
MMTLYKQTFIVAIILCATAAWGQLARRASHIGYIYPGGGQQDSVTNITIGGQFLRGVDDVYISGEGVHAKVIKYYRPTRNIQREQREELGERLRSVWEARLAELPEKDRKQWVARREFAKRRVNKAKANKTTAKSNKGANKPKAAKNTNTTDKKKAAKKGFRRPVDHPLLYDLENHSLRDLHHLCNHLFFPRLKKQINSQIGEMALIEITIDRNAKPGDRELRLQTRQGLTNPMVFQVGQLPEVRELEPNEVNTFPKLPAMKPFDLPVTINGQIMPGDVDTFYIRAKKGQQLVMQVHARRLIPYLADAVPGWFQATLAMFDAKGKEIAYADDYRFNPDPVLYFKIPADGVYELEIRDSIYRGREDFVYRIEIGEQPFITSVFPLGGRSGVAKQTSITGWNLSGRQMKLDTKSGKNSIRQTAVRQGKWVTNTVAYAVDDIPEYFEKEPNNTKRKAGKIELPRIINGRIGKPGDVDIFKFKGKAGDEVVAEVYARRLNSPLDSMLQITDSSGRVLKWNDDNMQKDGHLHRSGGLQTHHADSYLRAQLPKNGTYLVHLSDSQHHGSSAYGYRLRLSSPRPDFSLSIAPSSINVPAGSTIPIHMYAMRKDGFDGDIKVSLKGAPNGFKLDGAFIQSGKNSVRMTLTAPQRRIKEPIALRLEGRATINGKVVRHQVVPTENMMQAFLYRHLAPSRELMVATTGSRGRRSPAELASNVPVRVAVGGKTRVRIKTSRSPKNLRLALDDAPAGLSIQNVRSGPEGLAFDLKADGNAENIGLADNLIIEAYVMRESGGKNAKAPKKKRRVSLGILPAIPFKIVLR